MRDDGTPVAGPRRPGRRRVLLVGQTLGSAGLLTLVGLLVDPAAIVEAIGQADIGILLGMVLLVQAQLALSAWRWRLTAGALGISIGWRLAFEEYALASGLNQVLPGGMAGDAVRAWRHGRRGGEAAATGWGPILRTVVLERTAGQVAFLAVTAIGFLFWPLLLPDLPGRLVGALIAGIGGAIALIAVGLFLARRLGPAAWRDGVAALGPDLRRAFLTPRLWPLQLLLSLGTALGFIGLLGLASAAIGAPLPLAGWLSVVPLTLLTMLIPVSVGGWGVREGTAALLWPLAGLAAADGVAASVVYGAVTLVGTAPGVLAALLPKRGAARD